MDSDLHIKEIQDIIEALLAAESRRKRLAILKANKSNHILALIVTYTSGLIKSNITRRKIEQHIFYIHEPPDVPDNWGDMIKYYELNPTGTDEDIAVTQLYIKKYPKQYRESLSAIICGEIDLKITQNMVKEVFGEENYESTHHRTGNTAT